MSVCQYSTLCHPPWRWLHSLQGSDLVSWIFNLFRVLLHQSPLHPQIDFLCFSHHLYSLPPFLTLFRDWAIPVSVQRFLDEFFSKDEQNGLKWFLLSQTFNPKGKLLLRIFMFVISNISYFFDLIMAASLKDTQRQLYVWSGGCKNSIPKWSKATYKSPWFATKTKNNKGWSLHRC